MKTPYTQDVAILQAAKEGNLETLRALIAAGADVNAKLNHKVFDGHTPLTLAAVCGRADSLRVLIAAGADVNIHYKKEFRDLGSATALHATLRKGHEECTRILLQAGADVNAAAVDGMTALALACKEGGQAEPARMLLESGHRG